MKLYIWVRKDAAIRIVNFYPLSMAERVEPNGIIPIACHAFFTKREAIKYIKSIWNEEIISGYRLLSIEIGGKK